MGGWEWAIYLFLTYLASERKKQSYDRGVSQQRAVLADEREKRKKLQELNAAKRTDLLAKLDPSNVKKDAIIKSQRIQDLQRGRGGVGRDKLISGTSPQVVKNAMEKAMEDVSANVSQRGIAKANLDSQSNLFGKYAPELTEAQVLAQTVASKLKGNRGVAEVGVAEAGRTYDQPGDILGQLAQLYGMYAMGQGKDPKIVS